VRTRRLESAAYPLVGLALGMVFTMGLMTNLIRSGGATLEATVVDVAPASEPKTRKLPRLPWQRLLHPLTAILAVQAGLSLTLVWSNTAFDDEADYLSLGHYLIAHWLHGTPWPSVYGDHTLSGSPIIYPPIGAMADAVGGLAGARILSLMFMLGATALLYFTAQRLFGNATAMFGTALWAVSEPTLRLAFATYDPLSLLLTALAAWLVVQAGSRYHRGELITAAAAALALANVTAYSGVIITPVVIGFAVVVWLPSMGRQAWSAAGWLAAGWGVFFGAGMTLSHSWPGIMYTVIDRQVGGRQGFTYVLRDIWGFGGIVLVLAAIGVVISLSAKDRRALLLMLAAGLLAVPAAQLHDVTITSLDKHLSYGLWFGTMAAGYGISRLIQKGLLGRRAVTLCAVAALAYPAVVNWEAAWSEDHVWPNASSFVTSFRKMAASASGIIYVPGNEYHISEYYAPAKFSWTRLSGSNLSYQFSFDPALPRSRWTAYYNTQLRVHHYGAVVLVYETTFSARLPRGELFSSSGTTAQILGLVGANSGEPGLPALTFALESDHAYRIVAVGPYNTTPLSGSPSYGTYAIWERVGRS
ncbi:MAG: hypothetical protein ABSF53_26270, partial [Terracidiphilus sp.]